MTALRRRESTHPASLNRLFASDFFDRFLGADHDRPGDRQLLALADWAPAVDVSEDDKSYRIKADLPGVQKADIHVSVEHGVLQLSGERRSEKVEDDPKTKVHRVERAYGRFARSFDVPEDVDVAAVQANAQDGVLEVLLPKKIPAPTHRTTVKVA